MRGTRGARTAARLAERYLYEHRLSGLTSTHEPKLVGGTLLGGRRASDATKQTEQDEDHRNIVHFGDALVHLRETIRPGSAQTCVTSPPFFGQRDFGTRHWFDGDSGCRHDNKVTHGPFDSGLRTSKAATTHSCSRCGGWYGQIGQEPDVAMFVGHLVMIFREVRRVLRDDGVCWIEIGDSYNAGTTAPSPDSGGTDVGSWQSRTRTGRRRTSAAGLRPKSLLLIPQRLAIALQEDGWVVRAEIVFHKLTALPESVNDRPTRAHTTILMLTRCPSYFYDATAVLEAVTGGANASSFRRGRKEARPGTGNKANTSFHAATGDLVQSRNCRDVWSFVSGKFPEAHTATFPAALPERCIRASTSEHGACAKCGAPWRRVLVAGPRVTTDKGTTTKFAGPNRMRAARLGMTRAIPAPETIGWEPACECGTSEVRPCIVLDPFAGSGTTLMVAKQLGRDYVGIELNENEYRPIIEKRLADASRPPARTHTSRPASRGSAQRS